MEARAAGINNWKGIRPAKVFIYALALAALGGGGYLVYDRIRRKKLNFGDDSKNSNDILPSSANTLISSGSQITKTKDNLPLKKGSSGSRVLALQQALTKLGASSVAMDGKFGKGLQAALKKAGYPTTIDEKTFNKITGSVQTVAKVMFNPGDIATRLYKAAQNKNVNGVITQLKRIKNVSDYSAVNEHYKKQGFIISKTIVTDLLDFAFKKNEDAKDLLRNEFVRIGLKEDDIGRWSLQGFPLFKDLITIRETFVVDAKRNRIPVKRKTILGNEIEVQNGMTWFRSVDNKILCVPTQDVKFT